MSANDIVMGQSSTAADGCFHVFLDVGANVGVHGRFLLEPHKYPKVSNVHQLFDEYFGTQRDNRDICVFEIEANPVQYPKIQAKADAYTRMGWRYYLIRAAASDHDGSMQFWHNQDEEYGETGFGARKRFSASVKVDVPVFRLSRFVSNIIVPRQLPSQTYGKYIHKKPKVVMKMDIEGSEYVVFPDLLTSGALCSIDLIFGEDHGFLAPLRFDQVTELYSSNDLPELNVTKKDARRIVSYAVKIIDFSRTCKTKYLHYDTEMYGADGMPLP